MMETTNHNSNHNRRLNRDQNRVMLLIDADNVSADVITQAFGRVMAEQRAIHVRRAYCTAELAAKHLKLFKALSIRPIVNVSTGKNSTDIALAVDAIDLVISERPDVVVLVSSDSDFAPLVIRLREKGCRVEGIGQEGKTADDSKLVYDRFVDIEHRRSGAGTRSASNADAPVRKAAPRGRARVIAVEPAAARVAAKSVAQTPATAPARQARQPRAPREVAKDTVQEDARSRPPAASPAAAPSQAVQRSGTQLASRRPTLPDDLARIINVLPELSEGEPVRLALVAERLRIAGLVAKTAPSTKLFRKYPDWFLLTPDRQPHTVQYRGTANS